MCVYVCVCVCVCVDVCDGVDVVFEQAGCSWHDARARVLYLLLSHVTQSKSFCIIITFNYWMRMMSMSAMFVVHLKSNQVCKHYSFVLLFTVA